MEHTKTSSLLLLDKVRKIEGWLSGHEALFLYHAVRMVSILGEIVEIGSWKGKSTVCLAWGLKDSGRNGFVWAIDPHEGVLEQRKNKEPSTLPEFNRNIRAAGLTHYIKPIVSTSEKAVRTWSKPISFLFIDGLHDYTNTKRDYLLWKKFVSPGGVIAFHDGFCGISGVWRAIDEQFLTSNLIDIGTVSSILYGITGIPNSFQKMRVRSKIALIKIAQWINNRSTIPWWGKRITIHIFFRLLLVNRYIVMVYTTR